MQVQVRINQILSTSSPSEWLRDEATGTFIYRPDNNLRIERAPDNNWQEFNENWVPQFRSPNTKLIEYTVKYQNNIITHKSLVLLNGMANIPIPFSPADLRVNAGDVNFAKIVTTDPHDSLVDNWLRNCNFTIVA